jgi:hypothetical protein
MFEIQLAREGLSGIAEESFTFHRRRPTRWSTVGAHDPPQSVDAAEPDRQFFGSLFAKLVNCGGEPVGYLALRRHLLLLPVRSVGEE